MKRVRSIVAAAGMVVGVAACNTAGVGHLPNPLALVSQELITLQNAHAVGPIAVSPDGRFLAFSDGTNIFTSDLNDPTATPVQITSGTSAFAPGFLADGTLVFGSIDPATPDEIQFFSAANGTLLESPTPVTFGSVSAADLGLPIGTALSPLTQFNLNSGGVFATGVVNDNPLLLNFGANNGVVGVLAINPLLGQNITNPILSPDLSQLAFLDANRQIATAGFNNGIFDTTNINTFGTGQFPAFAPNGSLTFFSNQGFMMSTGANGFNTFGLGASIFSPNFPTFTADGTSFFTTNATGNGFIQTTIPSTTLPQG